MRQRTGSLADLRLEGLDRPFVCLRSRTGWLCLAQLPSLDGGRSLYNWPQCRVS
jgi:hypothetical protein